MVNFFKRMRKLNALLDVRTGTGAAILPTAATATKEFPAITRLHLTYAQKIYGGHQGARHFWRKCLPRLKFHNPAIPMTVRQTTEQEIPASLTIYFSERTSDAASLLAAKITDKHAPKPLDTEQSAILELKDLDFQAIWNKVAKVTGAQEVPPTAADLAQRARHQEMDAKSITDRARVAEIRQQRADRERMLKEAKGEIEKLKEI
ncbi:50S ribosomal protein Mrp49 [Aspergillus heteromorphus CBS 117.55]|uniref:50S ribosomal protein Mrp49 n=1 Tax=Aspergillus heteromorphus CBS 117.55 TaxID=1448321 RepID=A0A317WUA7_9EURO|nr:50S ribosomal protein Mrp49 [Aspergillus heteromorphus CBS 117.55]PWY88448.1 50S ribosomal protein Mrp49 [Aspergillus heteromorphus CBS 117.55]